MVEEARIIDECIAQAKAEEKATQSSKAENLIS